MFLPLSLYDIWSRSGTIISFELLKRLNSTKIHGFGERNGEIYSVTRIFRGLDPFHRISINNGIYLRRFYCPRYIEPEEKVKSRPQIVCMNGDQRPQMRPNSCVLPYLEPL